MEAEIKHISVCICTYKRPVLLEKLLNNLRPQVTEGLFNYSVVIIDNDSNMSAQTIVRRFMQTSTLNIQYLVEPEQNIALARNKAVENAQGDYIAFIDDDEFPSPNWLLGLFRTCHEFQADGILGPVVPWFESIPPQWMRKGKFFDRPFHTTGHMLTWLETRTGNVLFKKHILKGVDTPFRPEFGAGGEDVDFFKRMMKKGNVFIWCNEAIVYELVPQSRCRASYLLRRALNRGCNPSNHCIRSLTKSMVAVLLYTLALPVLAILGRHFFIRYLIKMCDHISRILAYFGWKLQRERAG